MFKKYAANLQCTQYYYYYGRSKEAGDLQHYLHVSRPPAPDTPPSQKQDCNTLAATPVYDLPEKCIIEQKVIELIQSHNRS